MGSLSPLQGIFPTQGSNPGLPHCRRIFYQLSHKGTPLPAAPVMENSSSFTYFFVSGSHPFLYPRRIPHCLNSLLRWTGTSLLSLSQGHLFPVYRADRYFSGLYSLEPQPFSSQTDLYLHHCFLLISVKKKEKKTVTIKVPLHQPHRSHLSEQDFSHLLLYPWGPSLYPEHVRLLVISGTERVNNARQW